MKQNLLVELNAVECAYVVGGAKYRIATAADIQALMKEYSDKLWQSR